MHSRCFHSFIVDTHAKLFSWFVKNDWQKCGKGEGIFKNLLWRPGKVREVFENIHENPDYVSIVLPVIFCSRAFAFREYFKHTNLLCEHNAFLEDVNDIRQNADISPFE